MEFNLHINEKEFVKDISRFSIELCNFSEYAFFPHLKKIKDHLNIFSESDLPN